MKKAIQILWLKLRIRYVLWKGVRLDNRYSKTRYGYDCGSHLAEYINPKLRTYREQWKAMVDEFERLKKKLHEVQNDAHG